jgi:hypothetical protein
MPDRIIAGTINPDGTIKYGQEFSVNRVSLGHYLISFRPSFAQVSGGAATQIYPDGDTRDNAVIITLNATDCLLKTGNSSGQAEDRSFTFIFAGTGKLAAKE